MAYKANNLNTDGAQFNNAELDPRFVRSIALHGAGNFAKLKAAVRATNVGWSEDLGDKGIVVTYQIQFASEGEVDAILNAIEEAGYTASSTRAHQLGARNSCPMSSAGRTSLSSSSTGRSSGRSPPCALSPTRRPWSTVKSSACRVPEAQVRPASPHDLT